MKKLTTIVAGFALLLSLSAFTPSGKAFFKINSVFLESFSTSSDVYWKQVGDAYIASFKQNGNYLAAAYSIDGTLLCVCKSISLTQVPFNVSSALNIKYAGFSINPEVIEVSADNTTKYVITVENEKFRLKLNADASGNLTVENKTKKK